MQTFALVSCVLLASLTLNLAQFLNAYGSPTYNPFLPYYDDPYSYAYSNMMNPYMNYGGNGMYMNPYFSYGLGNNMMGMNNEMAFSNFGQAGSRNRVAQRYNDDNRMGYGMNGGAHLNHIACRNGACLRDNNQKLERS